MVNTTSPAEGEVVEGPAQLRAWHERQLPETSSRPGFCLLCKVSVSEDTRQCHSASRRLGPRMASMGWAWLCSGPPLSGMFKQLTT